MARPPTIMVGGSWKTWNFEFVYFLLVFKNGGKIDLKRIEILNYCLSGKFEFVGISKL